MKLWKSLASSVLLFLVLFVPCTVQADPFVVNFDALDTSGGPVFGAALNGYLAGFGIAITSQVANPAVEVTNTVKQGGFVFPASPPNFLWSPGTNSPFAYQLGFSTPLESFAFTRVGYNAVASEWDARALDSNGNTLAQVGEPQGVFPATTFTLDPGSPISAVVFERTTINTFAGLNNPPTDDWVLEPVAEPTTLLLFGTSLAGLGIWRGRRLTKRGPFRQTQRTVRPSGRHVMALPRVGPLVATALLLYLSFPHFAHAIPLDFFVQATASNTVVSGVGDCSTGSVACSGNFDSGLLQASGVDLPGTILLTQPPALSGSASVSGFARLPNAVGRTGAELSLSAGTGADHSALSQPNFAGPSSASSLGFAQLGDKLTAVADLLPSLLLSKGSEVTLIATLESSLSVGPGAVANGDGAKFSGKGSAFFAAGLNDTTLRTVDSSANVVLAPQIRRIPFTVPLGEPVPISTILNVEAKANAGTLPDSNATVRTTGDVTLFIDSLTPGISYTTASNRDYRLCDSKCLFLLRQAQFNTAADIMNRISDKVDKVDPIGGWITRKVDQAIDRVLKDVAPDVPDGPTTVLLKETVHQGIDQVLEALPTSPAKPVQEVASWLSIGAKTLADLHRFLGNDPFDPNFAQVAQPIFGILPPTTLVSVAPQLLFVFRDVEGQADNFLAYSIALSVSFNRYLSALQANDGQSAAVQLGAINQYLELYLSAQKLLGVAIASLRAEILREQADVAIDAAGFMAFQAQIRTNGLPTDIRNALRDAGASDADIADLIATFLAVDSDSWPSGTLTDALGILSDDFSEDLTPQATPEPTTLLLFGTTMAGLGLAARRRRRRSKQSRGV